MDRQEISRRITDTLDTISADKENIIDMIMDRCCGCNINIPIRFNEIQTYEITFEKVSDSYFCKENM